LTGHRIGKYLKQSLMEGDIAGNNNFSLGKPHRYIAWRMSRTKTDCLHWHIVEIYIQRVGKCLRGRRDKSTLPLILVIGQHILQNFVAVLNYFVRCHRLGDNRHAAKLSPVAICPEMRVPGRFRSPAILLTCP